MSSQNNIWRYFRNFLNIYFNVNQTIYVVLKQIRFAFYKIIFSPVTVFYWNIVTF